MAYANKVARVTIFGEMFGGSEEWSTGFFCGAAGADAIPGNEAFATVLKTAWQTFFTNTAHGISNRFNTQGVKVALMGTNGKTELDSVLTSYYTAPIVGGYAALTLPPQVSLVAQLAAGTAKGLGGKGRMYLPGISFSVGESGKITASNALAIATGLKAVFDAVNGSIEHPGFVVNASQGRLVAGGAGPITRPVTAIRVGDVYDTQRRRRNALSESYSQVTIAG